jgi:tRNA threonylcarbamoyladenosine biosynthesis protein TsaE
VYQAPLPLIHVDVYRLLDSGKAALFLDDLDLDSDRENCVTVVEWGGSESARLSDQRLEITIDRSDEVRKVSFNCVGNRWAGFSA